MSARRASVIIPAHDEEDALPTTLGTMLADVETEEFEVIVVANGCTDDTAGIARQVGTDLGAALTVVEVPMASKTSAMNAGDDVAITFPRIYLDADVVCRPETLRGLAEALETGSAELAVPTRRLDLTTASWWVRQYYRAWQELPRVAAELSGRGAYGFSRAGRMRFARFPAIIADDHWAVRQVPRDHAVVVAHEVTIRPPQTLRTLVLVRSRIYAANQAALAGESDDRPRTSTDLWFLIRRPRRWLRAALFLATNAYIKAIGVRRRRGYGRDSVRGATRPTRVTSRTSVEPADRDP